MPVDIDKLAFKERLGLMVDREITEQENSLEKPSEQSQSKTAGLSGGH